MAYGATTNCTYIVETIHPKTSLIELKTHFRFFSTNVKIIAKHPLIDKFHAQLKWEIGNGK